VSIEEAHAVPSRYVPVACVLSLLGAFGVDLLTPQLFVAAILLDVPIVLSSLGSSARFRVGLIVAALACDIIAGYVNGLQDGHHWSAIAIGDRLLAALSIGLVGYLSFAVIDNAQRAGQAESQELRSRREAQISAAIERVRASLSTELVLRAIAHESVELLDATEARFVLTGPPVTTLVARHGRAQVDVDEARLPPAAISLVQRAADDGDVIAVGPTDALGRLILDTFGAPEMLALPIADRERRFGVLLVLGEHADRLEELRSVARGYANQAASALEQARLFEQLAERNAALEESTGIIRDLVYALSHDLRTPLAALGMTLRQAQAGRYGELPERYREIVDRSVIATDDVQRLAETLLLVARFESGVELDFEFVHALLRPKPLRIFHDLHRRCCEQPLRICADLGPRIAWNSLAGNSPVVGVHFGVLINPGRSAGTRRPAERRFGPDHLLARIRSVMQAVTRINAHAQPGTRLISRMIAAMGVCLSPRGRGDVPASVETFQAALPTLSR